MGDKVSDKVDDRMGVDKSPEDIAVDNNNMGDSRNQDNQCATIEDVLDFNDRITNVVDFTDEIFVNVLTHLFGPLSH